MKKFNIQDLWYGLLHVMVALSAVLFVCGVTGINLPLSFLTIGIGTLIFHAITGNKLAVLMGVSGSFVGGMAVVGAEYGPGYVAGGVVLAGLIYSIAGLIIRKRPDLYDKFPKYILNSAVFLIALNLMPIGASMIGGNIFIATVTILVGFLLFNSKRFGAWAFPGALIVGTAISALTGNLVAPTEMVTLTMVSPQFNMASFTLIGVVALAVVFESLGDSRNCANAQGITLEGKDFGNILLGNGAASTASGLMGGLPLTTYSENIGFIYLTNYKRPQAQIVAAIAFIVMAFIPQVSTLMMWIPGTVYGAMLLFLFSLIAVNSIRNIDLKEDSSQKVLMSMLLAYFVTPASVFSPIASGIIIGFITHVALSKKKA